MSEKSLGSGLATRIPGLTRRTMFAMGGGLVLAACSGGGGGGGGDSSGPEQLKGVLFGTEEQSTGPAEAVAGGKSGGTLYVLEYPSLNHLDPAQIYVSNEGYVAKLIHRGLTTVHLTNDGDYVVIGDLATDSGTTSDDGKTWTYTLKDDIKWKDGSPVTSADVRRTFERLFADYITDGPIYIQQWMANSADYRGLLEGGPYQGDHLPDTILETPDDKTVIFHFEESQAELPYALAMAGYAIVSKEHDTKEDYDKDPMTSGPYQISSYESGKSMTLVRNEHWEASTDAARNAYPDRWEITFGHEYEDTTSRMMADRGDDQYAVTFSNSLDSDNGSNVVDDAQYDDRLIDGFQPYVGMMAINMNRVKNKKVREAICHALPLNGILNPVGGSLGGEYAGGYISPLLPAYEDGYDPYGKLAKPEGDTDKARQLLEEADAVGYELSLYHHNQPEVVQQSVAVKNALENAGFSVDRIEGPQETYYEDIGKVDNEYDLYRSNWGHDWLSAATVIPPLFDGRTIADGASNYTHYNSKHVNSEIDRIKQIGDSDEAAKEWFELGKYILEEDLPAVPIYYYRQIMLHGSKVGGGVFNDDLGTIDMLKIYVTDA